MNAANRPGAPAKLLYILAASHSGSTLLALLLGSHRDVCTVGELKIGSLGDPHRYLCSCHAKLVECEFWARVTVAMHSRGLAFQPIAAGVDFSTGASPYVARLLRPLYRGGAFERLRQALLACSPTWRRQLAALQARNAALVRSVLDTTESQVVVDSSKTGLRLQFLLENRDLDVRVIRLTRDGRAVALTYVDPSGFADAKNSDLRGGGTGVVTDARSVMSMTDAAMIWRRSNEEAEAVVRAVPTERVLRLRYEDLCVNTDSELDNIFRFVGVDPVRRAENFRSVTQHVVGNGMRLDTDSEVRLDERWRTVLTSADLESFDRVAGDLNRELGYE